MKKSLLVSLISFAWFCSFFVENPLLAQSENILLVTDINSKITVDGSDVGQLESGKPLKIATSVGDHYIQAAASLNGKNVEKDTMITVEQGKQKFVKISFKEIDIINVPSVDQSITVANLNVTIPGTLTISTWNKDHPGEKYPVPEYFYAFEKGDVIVINLKTINKKGTNAINISTYPNRIEKYTNDAFTELDDLKIKVEERSIYRIAFASNFAFDRNGLFSIKRIPASSATTNFNTGVLKKKIYAPVTVQESQNMFVNSGSNATFSGGKSRVILPIKLPANTIQWFYRFSASRSREDIDNVKSKFGLFSELSKLSLDLMAGPEAGKIAGIAVNQLSMPPGADYCDIYLLDYNSITAFEAKIENAWKYYLEGSRENFMSGNVRITEPGLISKNLYLGIKNPSTYYGISIFVEVVAITYVEDWIMEN